MSQALPNTPNEVENAKQPRKYAEWPKSEMKAFPGTGYGGGMELRDYFASKAMSLFAKDGDESYWIAEQAYKLADAMMIARKR